MSSPGAENHTGQVLLPPVISTASELNELQQQF